MFVIRDIFQLQFGRARDAKESITEFAALLDQEGYGPVRLLSDFTGPSYRLILEFSVETLAAYEDRLGTLMTSDKWRTVYQKYATYVASSYREILKAV